MQALLATQFFGPNDNGVKPINATNILTNTITKTRGGRDATLSGFFTFDCTGAFPSSLPRLDRGWLPADVVVVSDGGCGSACACMVRSLRDAHKIKSYVYGGSSGKPYTPTSFEGGIVLPYSSIATYPNNGYSRLGRLALEYPAEWIPYPADEWLGIANPSDRISVWNAVAAKMADPATAPVTTGTGKSGAGRTSWEEFWGLPLRLWDDGFRLMSFPSFCFVTTFSR
ncbi:hypothetical protein BC829DRAFT_420830 [Chytridium lagenaria]|nr:hypothetical protein BC829DRAFT_420830 [Chytridium lagenaria]